MNKSKTQIKKQVAMSLILAFAWLGHPQAQEIDSEAQGAESQGLLIDSVECLGNILTSCEIIQREINLGPGDHLDEEEMKNAKTRLQLLGLFKSVSLFLEKGQARGHVVVKIQVTEGNPFFTETSLAHYLYPNFKIGSTGLGFKVGHRNLFGRGKILQMTLAPGRLSIPSRNDFSGGLEYSDPHFLGLKKYFLNVSANYWQYEYYRLFSGRPVRTNSLQTRINFGRRIFDFSYVGLGLNNYESRTIEAPEDGGSTTTYSSPTYTLSTGWNNEDDPYFPTEGGVIDLTYYLHNWKQDGRELATQSASIVFKQNFEIAAKQTLSIGGGYSYMAKNQAMGDSWFAKVGPEWSYQFLRAASEKSITDVRFFINPITMASLEGPSREQIDAGVILNTKDYGILRLTATYWGDPR
ncbi:MAG: hypothetical protein JNM39_04740 [Bdellovibrionaceae bacterium]|nr:hypothetical protein [Pseudobdellovibrionaceae bacterium]